MLTTPEYSRIMTDKRILQTRINSLEAESERHEQAKEKIDAQREGFQEEMSLYSNFLCDAIEEYEAAHPPPEPA